ncbi:MAG: TrkA family potassium uptake protein [Chloroflexi bacterium]|nr:TrkA family potassium uptake protein [Chloroflexota bacterium]
MKVVILGCGRLGSHLARRFDREGHDVSVIDRTSESFARLGTDFRGTMILGTGIDEDVMRRAGIENADAFVAVTAGDNTNAMAAQIAKLIFKVPRVIARFNDPVHEDTYHTLGLMETISPTIMGSNAIHGIVTGKFAAKEDKG